MSDKTVSERFLATVAEIERLQQETLQGLMLEAALSLDGEEREQAFALFYWQGEGIYSAWQLCDEFGYDRREYLAIVRRHAPVLACLDCGAGTSKATSRLAAMEYRIAAGGSEHWRHRGKFRCPDCTGQLEEAREAELEAQRANSREAADRQRDYILWLRSIPYAEYLQTEHWQQLRAQKQRQAGRRCQLCYAGGQLDTHHRTYERRGFEQLSDLIVLCRPCHAKFHDRLP